MSGYTIRVTDDREEDFDLPEGAFEIYPAFIGDRFIVRGPGLDTESWTVKGGLERVAARIADLMGVDA